jgi:diguanylate cyclase (GGDEF)-like protein
MAQRAAQLRSRPAPSGGRGTRRLLVFAGLLGIAGAALWLVPLRDAHRLTAGPSAPWWALFLGCYVCSLLYVQVRVRRTGSTVSLTEIPVVVGLFLVDPRVLLLTYLAGVLLGNWTRRGVRPALDAANLMLDTLTMGVTVLVFGLVGPSPSDPLAPQSVLALATAMAAAGWIVGPLAVNAGVALVEGTLDRHELWHAYLFQAAANLVNTCLGLLALAMIVSRPLVALVLLPPVALVFAGQLAAGEGQRRASRMEFLFNTNNTLHTNLPMGERYREMLEACLQTFAANRAELIVIPESRETPVRFYAGGRDQHRPMAASALTFGEQEMLNALRSHQVISGAHDAQATPLGLLLEERAAGAGTVALLQGHERVLGMIMLLDPAQRQRAMPSAERHLLATVAGQLSVALENGQLADAVKAMTLEREVLARKASHDALTQLPNRTLFTETVNLALANLSRTMRYAAVMFIDLDGFKAINDTRGHAVGDELLCSIAARLRQQVRKHDLAARLAGDEFAVLLQSLRHPDDARMVATRIVDSLLAPLLLAGVETRLGGSVGVAVVSDYNAAATAEELLHQADMAMYLAKRQGKGRFVVFDSKAREPVLVARAGREVPEAAAAVT